MLVFLKPVTGETVEKDFHHISRVFPEPKGEEWLSKSCKLIDEYIIIRNNSKSPSFHHFYKVESSIVFNWISLKAKKEDEQRDKIDISNYDRHYKTKKCKNKSENKEKETHQE